MLTEEKIINRIDKLIEKGNKVLATHKSLPQGVVSALTLDLESFMEWKTQTLNFLINLLGENHVYVQTFREEVRYESQSNVKKGMGILRAVREDVLGGYLVDVKTLISAEIFTDFLEMAEYLLESGYKDPAASLCGAVLENGLRKIASEKGVKINFKENLSTLNQKCADAEIYNRLMQRRIYVWIEIRNKADHGEFSEYSKEDVQEMIKGVRQFLTDHLK